MATSNQHTIVINVDQRQLKALFKQLGLVQKRVQKLNQTSLNLGRVRTRSRNIKGTGRNTSTNENRQIRDDASPQLKRQITALNNANKALNEYVRKISTADGAQRGFAGSTNKISTQVSALRDRLKGLTRSNSEYTSTLAAVQRGEQALFQDRNKRLGDESKRLATGGKGGTKDLVTNILNEDFTESIDGINNYINRLEALKNKVNINSQEFKNLQQRIAEVNKTLESTQLEKPKKEPKPQKTKSNANQIKAIEEQRANIIQRINDSSLGEAKKSELINNLKRVKVGIQKEELALAKQINVETQRNLTSSEKRQRRRQRIGQSALIGGGFPLLFGGGPVQAIGGALGGGIGEAFSPGGGFAGSIAVTAAVNSLGQLATSARELGEAVRTTSGTFDLMTQRSLFSSEAVEAQARSLEKQGKQTQLASLLTDELNKVLGVGSVGKLKELGLRSREMNREFGILSTQLQLFIAGPLTAFIKQINKILGKNNIIGAIDSNLKRVRKELGPEEADKRLLEISQFMTPRERFANPFRIGGLSALPGFKSGAVGGVGFADSIRQGINIGGVKDIKRLLEISQISSRGLSSEQIGSSPLDAFNNIRPTVSKLDELQAETKLLERSLQIGSKAALQQKEAKEIFAEQVKLNKDNLSVTEANILKQIKQRDALTEQLNLQQQIKDLLSTGMTDAVMGLIDGTKTLSESLSGIARQLASLFLNRAFSAMFGGFFGEQGGYLRSGSFKAFQYGGVVSSPTLGMIGEGGEPEYVIPSSKMDGAMARYSAGARGGAVIPGGSGASGTVAGSSGNTIVEYTGPVLNFNGDEYVPKDSVPQIINAAAKQGATLGQSRTLNTLKNSRSSRAKIGI